MKSKIRFHGQFQKDEDSIRRIVEKINVRNQTKDEDLNFSNLKHVQNVKLERIDDSKNNKTQIKKLKRQDLFKKFNENKSKLITKTNFAIEDKHYEKFIPKQEIRSMKQVISI